MIRKMYLAPRVAVLSACLLAILSGSPVTAYEEDVTLRGAIEIAERDDDGNVAAVVVHDNEWGSVLISDEGTGKQLLGHVGAVATIIGTIVETDDDSGYSYTITVDDYTIEEPEEPEEEPDDEPDPDYDS